MKKVYAIIYNSINSQVSVQNYLYLGEASSLDEARRNGYDELDNSINLTTQNGHSVLPSTVFKPGADRNIELSEIRLEFPQHKIVKNKNYYIANLEYARDNFCRLKAEKELINKIIVRCQKKNLK